MPITREKPLQRCILVGSSLQNLACRSAGDDPSCRVQLVGTRDILQCPALTHWRAWAVPHYETQPLLPPPTPPSMTWVNRPTIGLNNLSCCLLWTCWMHDRGSECCDRAAQYKEKLQQPHGNCFVLPWVYGLQRLLIVGSVHYTMTTVVVHCRRA